MFHSKGGAKIFEDFKRIANKFPEAAAAIAKKTGMEETDLIVLIAGSAQIGSAQAGSTQTGPQANRKVTPQELAIYASAGLLRLALAQKYSEKHGIFKKTGDAAKDFRFLWVTNFPMFEWDEGEKTWMAAHHPFTSPHEEDMAKLESGVEALHDPLSPLSAVRALAYDVVLNGTELGSGSIRIHRQDVQSRIFRALGMREEEARARFGFFLEALEYGTPPHGGIALGLDRIVMILAGAESLREVIPFPKTARAVDLMVDAPTSVVITQEEQLELMAAWPELSEREWKLARLCDDLLEAVTEEVLHKKLPVDTSLQQASAVILGKAWNDAKAAVKLAKAGYGVQAAAVSRSLVEATINLRYIEKDPENRAEAFLRLMGEENRKLIRRVKLHPVSKETQDAIDRIPDSPKGSLWPASIMERAYDVQKPYYDYDVVFPMLSQLLHSTPPAMAGQLKEDGQQQFRMQIGRSHEWVDTALATVFLFFAQIADSSFKTFNLSNERLESLAQAFTKVGP
jgi:hypothetical protein